MLEQIFIITSFPTNKKVEIKKLSRQLNLLRVILRICKETKTIDNKKYIVLEIIIDEIDRMVGGWIKSVK